jgi:FtsP/CotA-like multicopper oxidase with cupredoxin domain
LGEVCVLGWAALTALTLFFPHSAHADADEYNGLAWNPTSTPAHPCGIGIPQRGNFPRDRWVNARKPTVTLTVKQAGTVLCYVSDGIAEAPVLRVQQGQTLTITLRNEISDPKVLERLLPASVGRDRSVSRVPHRSAVMDVVPGRQPSVTGRTNLHLHGFAVPPVAPQDEVLMGCADPAVGPAACGQREITYRFQIPADMPAGLYWYHPHVHGEVQAQMLAGLTGALVVEGPDDQARNEAGVADRVFIVRQLQDTDSKGGVAANSASGTGTAPSRGALNPNTAAPAIPTLGTPVRYKSPAPAGTAIDTRHELGCTNNATIDEISLNGAPVVDGVPKDSDLAPLAITEGTTQLWRIVNAATDAFLDLALIDETGELVPIQVVARDGAPLTDDDGHRIPTRSTSDSQLVPPAGRIEFLVSAPPTGRKVYFVSHAVATGCTGDAVPERRLGLLVALPYKADHPTQSPAIMEPTANNFFSGLMQRKARRQRVIVFAEYPRPGDEDQTDYYIAERRAGGSLVPYTMDGPPTITVPADSVEEWTVENWTNELHAFHIHQVHFRVLEVNGQPVTDPPLLDTVTVPAAMTGRAADVTRAGQSAIVPGSVRVKMFFPASLAGDIPFHCHLVDHEDNGMMGVLRVVPLNPPESADQPGPP